MNKDLAMQFEAQTGSEIKEHELCQLNEPYRNTPIWIRGYDEQGYFGTLGDNRITEVFKNKWEVEEILDFKDWNVILNIIASMIHATLQIKEREAAEADHKSETNQ